MFRPQQATTRLYLNCRQAHYDENLLDWTKENHQNLNNSRLDDQLTFQTPQTTLHSAHSAHLSQERLSQLTAVTFSTSINRELFVAETVGEESCLLRCYACRLLNTRIYRHFGGICHHLLLLLRNRRWGSTVGNYLAIYTAQHSKSPQSSSGPLWRTCHGHKIRALVISSRSYLINQLNTSVI
jgi:hypothetical protein